MGKARRTKKQNNNNNKEKETTKTRERKKQKIKHHDTEEDSNSSTNVKNQSQSGESPASARKPSIVDLKKIDSRSRRASLRSSKAKKLIETGKIDLSRCSHPQKSIEHFSSTHAIRQLEDLAHLVPQGSKVESPSRYLKQVDPNLRYREIEKGGKCVVEKITDEELEEDFFLDDIIARMKEGKEAEKEVPLVEKPVDEDNELESRERSLSNGQHINLDQFEVVCARIASLKRPREAGMTDLSKSRKHFSTPHAIQQLQDLAYQVPQSSQVESPSRYLKQGEPSLRHEEIEKDGTFAAEENLGDGIGEKQAPLVDKPISTVSFGITEFVKNMDVDEDDEVDSQICSLDTVEGYTVKPEFRDILRNILIRHGDIAKNCTVSTMKFRSALLEMICGIISELQGKNLKQIKIDVLHDNINVVDEIKSMEVDIEWLRRFLVDLLKAKQELGENIGENIGNLKKKKDSDKKIVEDAERKLAQLQEQKRELSNLLKSKYDEEIVCKEALAKAKDKYTKTAQAIKSSISNAKRFLDCSPVDYLP